MKKGAKRQVVICPACFKFKVTLGEGFFRCCGENHKIIDHLASPDLGRAAFVRDDSLEVQV